MTLYAYLRVSTDQQVDSRAGLNSQEDLCRRWASKHDRPLEAVYVEEGVSGATGLDKRPALLQAIAVLGKGDIILVSQRDRIGRDPILVAMIEAAVERKRAKIISVAGEGTESSGPTDILMRRMVDAFAEFERNIIRQRTRGAMAAKKMRKERVGHVPFGYRVGDGKSIVTDEDEQQLLAEIRGMVKGGMSGRKIADELNRRDMRNRNGNRWNHCSIYNAMRNASELVAV